MILCDTGKGALDAAVYIRHDRYKDVYPICRNGLCDEYAPFPGFGYEDTYYSALTDALRNLAYPGDQA